MRDVVQEVYNRLPGSEVDKKKHKAALEEHERNSKVKYESVTNEEYKRRILAHLKPKAQDHIDFAFKPSESRPVSGQSNVSRVQYLGGQHDVTDNDVNNNSQIPMLDQNDMDSQYSNSGQMNQKSSLASSSVSKKKVKFDGNGNGSNGNGANGTGSGGAFEKSNYQPVREKPNFEELMERNEDEERLLMQHNSQGAVSQLASKKTRTNDIYDRWRRVKDKYRN